jgi:hypothetical protein
MLKLIPSIPPLIVMVDTYLLDLTGTSRSKWGGVATAHSLTYYLASSIHVNLGGLPRPYPRPGMHSRYKSVGLSIYLART